MRVSPMSIKVSDVRFEYVSAKSGNTVKGIHVIAGQYPWDVFSQDCLRIMAAYKVLGPDGLTQLLKGFVDGVEFQPNASFEYATYQGHKLLRLKADSGDKRALQFGAGKAKGLLALIDGLGMRDFVGLVNEVAGDAQVSQYSGKGKAKGGSKGGAGKGGPKVEADTDADEYEADTLPAPSPKVEANPVKATPPAPKAETPADSADALLAEEQMLLARLIMVRRKLASMSVSV